MFYILLIELTIMLLVLFLANKSIGIQSIEATAKQKQADSGVYLQQLFTGCRI